jgi:amino acid adenylation domain-containing protein
MAQVLMKNDGSLTVTIQANGSRISASKTADVSHTLSKVLHTVLRAHPDSKLRDMDILSQRDHDKIMSWNGSSSAPVDRCFHLLFSDITQRYSDEPAICSWDGNLTYRELDTLSSKIANHLVGLGAVLEMSILFCFNKSCFAIVSMLSILKAGGAFVAIDPSYPISRINAIVEATSASMVLTDASHSHLFQGIVQHVVAIGPSSVDNLPVSPHLALPQTIPSNAAYVNFTSGSTGVPKGIVVEHRALCTAVSNLALPMRISSTSRMLQFAAYIFDLSLGDIFVTLSQGGCICIPSEDERINDLAGAILRMNVNTACLIPSIARIFQPSDVPCLKTLLLGGEALSQDNLELWAEKVALANLYGPSECTIWCTANTELKVDTSANNIGRGLGVCLWITSTANHDRLAPVGCVGELLIEGPALARGYLNAEQTRTSFIENPTWGQAENGRHRRFYKTGDLVRYNHDGTVGFIGRKDTQIKLHGRRIEMGEIEHHMSSHQLLRQSLVMMPASGPYANKIVAIVALKFIKPSKAFLNELKPVSSAHKERANAEVELIKNSLSSKISSYMLPQFWFVVQDIPLMISGKMNRVLAKKFVETIGDERLKATPKEHHPSHCDPVEIRLQDIWSDVLDRNSTDVGFEQEFCSLGGDSFSAMTIVARCRAERFSLTVSDICNSSTIRGLASVIKSRSSATIIATEEDTIQKISCQTVPPGARTCFKLVPIWWHSAPISSI